MGMVNHAAWIKGITVTLYDRQETGVDNFNRPVYARVPLEVDNVLVSPASSDDITDTLNLTGKRAIYTLGIPKGDTHEWEDREVEFFGETFHTIGFVTEGIENMIPLEWDRKIEVERYG